MKTILATLTGQEGDEAALLAAHTLGKLFASHLTGMHAALDAGAVQHVAVKLGSAGVLEAWLQSLKKSEVAKSHAAKAAFDKLCSSRAIPYAKHPGAPGLSASWKEIAGDPLLSLLPETRLHDVTVMAANAYEKADIGTILMSSGRPLLLVPLNHPEPSFDKVLVAWKDTREAAHAVTAAMPLLEKARRVVVASANEHGSKDCEHSAKAAAECLRWHGIAAEPLSAGANNADALDAILGCAHEQGAGLIVMGGYGHSRAHEMIFGGFTRRVLGGLPIPVLLCH